MKRLPQRRGAQVRGGIGDISGLIVDDPGVVEEGIGRGAGCSKRVKREKGEKEVQQDPTRSHGGHQRRQQEQHLWGDQKRGPQGPNPWAG